MIRATATALSGSFNDEQVVDTVELDFEDRRRRRMTMTGRGGLEFLVDLADVPAIGHGDGYRLENGLVVRVEAKPEKLVEFRVADPGALARIAWHLGNRHTPTELRDGALRIRDDYVLVEMVKKLGTAEIGFVEAAFVPEGGAYGYGQVQGHDHAGHAHTANAHAGQGHAAIGAVADDPEMLAAIERRRQRQAARAAALPHVHGPDCGCGHEHHGHEQHGHEQHGHEHHDHEHEHHRHERHGHEHAHGKKAHAEHSHHDHSHHDHAHHDQAHQEHEHGEGCGCGHHGHEHGHKHGHEHEHGHHGHKHEHKHGEGCCGGDHAHAHEHGHKHEHEHKHEHKHGHKHEHAHDEGCGCGHGHGKHG